MNCGKARDLMIEYLYDELSARRKKALEKHLRKCAACSEELAAQKTTVSTFGNLRMEEPPERLSEVITDMAQRDIEQHALLHARSRRYWRPAMAAAAAMLVLVCVWYFLPQAAKDNRETQKLAAMRRGIEAPRPQESAAAGQDNAPLKRSANEGASYKDSEFRLGQPSDELSAEVSAGRIARDTYPPQKAEASAPASAATPTSRTEVFARKTEIGQPAAEPAAEPSAELNGEEEAALEEEAVFDSVHSASAPEPERLIVRHFKAKSSLESAGDRYSGAKEEKDLKSEEEFAKGNEFFKENDFHSAILNYQGVIDRDPQGQLAAEARYRLGESYQELGQYEKAISEYERIINDYPDFPQLGETYIAAGDCYQAIGKAEEALRNFETVLTRFPALRDVAEEKIGFIDSQQKNLEKPEETSGSSK